MIFFMFTVVNENEQIFFCLLLEYYIWISLWNYDYIFSLLLNIAYLLNKNLGFVKINGFNLILNQLLKSNVILIYKDADNLRTIE